MRIGIVGMGVVGKALEAYYKAHEYDVYQYDKAYDNIGSLKLLNERAEIVFICVGTPFDTNVGELDCSQVYAAVDAFMGSKTVIIKSTVMPGTTDAVQKAHPEHKVFYVPEFLSEATAAEDYARPRRPHVIGMPEVVNKWRKAWEVAEATSNTLLPPFIIHTGRGTQYVEDVEILPARQAELLKLATNAFYAIKVTFANQMYDAGMTQETLDALGADPWIGGEHFQIVHKGFRGYGGKCLPKDTNALYRYEGMNKHGIPLSRCADDYNTSLLMGQGLVNE